MHVSDMSLSEIKSNTTILALLERIVIAFRYSGIEHYLYCTKSCSTLRYRLIAYSRMRVECRVVYAGLSVGPINEIDRHTTRIYIWMLLAVHLPSVAIHGHQWHNTASRYARIHTTVVCIILVVCMWYVASFYHQSIRPNATTG